MSDTARNDSLPKWVAPLQWISWAVGLIAVLLLVRALPVAGLLGVIKGWVAGFGPVAPAVFAAVYALWAVAFLPGAPLTLAAGALFGLGWGVAAALTGATAGASLAFLIGRYGARERVRRLAERNPKLAAVDQAVDEGGWKIVAMLRLSPAFPFNLQNYFYGVTGIGFWTCTLTSAVFMAPGTFLYVYLGHVGAQGLAAASGGAERTPAEWALLAVGLIATAAVTVYVTRLASKALKRQSGAVREAVEPEQERRSEGPDPRAALVSAGVAAGLLAAAVAVTLQPNLVRDLFGPPSVAFAEDLYPENPDGETFDHSRFDRVVSRFVDEVGLVDYADLRADPSDLEAYISSLGHAPFDALQRIEKLALLINAYNAFTLKLILENYPLDSIRDIPSSKRWDAKRWVIGGKTYSLSQIEHEVIRRRFAEPRIHFALVCAAYSCPKLRQEAYDGARLDAQLEDQTRFVHRHARWYRFEPAKSRAHLTKLYDWYGSDFKTEADSVLDYAARYDPELRQALDRGENVDIDWIDYDWSLNDQQ